MIVEIFKQIDGYPNYLISNLGNIKSLANGKERILKPFVDSKGRYLQITLCNNGERKKYLVHRLVALAFLPVAEGKNVVNHKDGNPQNNNVSNLEWCTTQENVHDSYKVMGPLRHFSKAKLISPDGYEMFFDSISAAQRYVVEHRLDVSPSSLRAYGRSKGYRLET